MTIKKRYQMKLAVGILLTLAGVVTAILMFQFAGPEGTHQQGYLAGIGAGLAVGGLVITIRFAYTLASEERLRKKEIEMKDERYQFLRKQAAAIALVISVIVCYVCSIVLTLLGNEESGRLLLSVGAGSLGLYAVTFLILQRIH